MAATCEAPQPLDQGDGSYHGSLATLSDAFTTSCGGEGRDELWVLDYNSGSGGRTRLVKISRGSDGRYGTSDDSRLSKTTLPTFLDYASGIAYRPSNGEVFFCSGGVSSQPKEVIVTNTQMTTELRRFSIPSSFSWPSDICFSKDRVVIVAPNPDIIVMDPDSGAVLDPSADPIADLPMGGTQLGNLGGVCAGFYTLSGVPAYAESPLFVANWPSGTERIVVYLPK